MEIYVNIHAQAVQDGSREHPFGTIRQAAAAARPGDEVIVFPGVYREWVQPPRGGTDDSHRIVYRSFLPGGAVISGAEELTAWESLGNGVYSARVPDSLFEGRNPYTACLRGDWLDEEDGFPHHLGEVFMNSRALFEAPSLAGLTDPSPSPFAWDPQPSLYRWFTAQEDGQTVLYVYLGGRDPNEEKMECTVRPACFFPKSTGISYITVSGFRLEKAATQWAPPTAFQEGLIGPNWAKGWVIEDCEIRSSKCAGISLGRYRQSGQENKWTTGFFKDGTQTQRETVLQALREGWTKENIGSHTVRGCEIHDCGQAGIVGHMGCAFSRIENCHIHHINTRQELSGAEIGGIKLHAAIDTVISGNHIHHCTRGLWLDWQAQGTRVTGNAFHHNEPPAGVRLRGGLSLGEDLFLEVSHGPTLVDRNLFLSAISCRLSAQGFAFCHNLIAGSFTFVGRGVRNTADDRADAVRYTPYHVPHTTDIAGFMTILGGDGRFLNNLFVQQPAKPHLAVQARAMGEDPETFFRCGTFPWEYCPSEAAYISSFSRQAALSSWQTGIYYRPLPMRYGGNVYLNGAVKDSKDTGAQEIPDRVSAQVIGDDGRWVLKTDLYRVLPETACPLIRTENLGLAFEPEQPFDSPDGSRLALDTDYFGRKISNPIPGPFLDGGPSAWILKERALPS